MKNAAIEILRFCKGHWHVPVAIPFMLLFFTVLHEGAHALAVVIQGGKVTEFVWLPTAGKWDHICYVFEQGGAFSSVAISLAPYVMWLCICMLAILLSAYKKNLPYWLAGAVFIWMYVGPLADIGNTAVGWLRGGDNDFTHTYGKALPLDILPVTGVSLFFMTIGYFLQRRLYNDRSVGVCAYVVLCMLTSGLLFAVAGIGLL